MAIGNLLSETRLTLGELAQRQKVSLKSVFRWTQGGVRGARLESFLFGGRRFTTEESFTRWMNEVNTRGRREETAQAISPDREQAVKRALDAIKAL